MNPKAFSMDDIFILQKNFKTPLKRITLPFPAIDETYEKGSINVPRLII